MGYAIVSNTGVEKAQALLIHTTNQQAEVIALTYTFQLTKGQFTNIYTKSKCTFHIDLFRAAIWKELKHLTTKGGFITNSGQIMTMLKASHFPKAI